MQKMRARAEKSALKKVLASKFWRRSISKLTFDNTVAGWNLV